MNIYDKSDEWVPYTYLIGWSKHNKWYYGSKTSKSKKNIAHPTDLWVTYFTSSKYVKKFREEHGEPDVIQVRKTFKDRESALLWEHKVLKRMKVTKSAMWLNKSSGGAKFNCIMVGDDNPSRRNDVRQKISDALQGRQFSDDQKNNMRLAKLGVNKGKTYEEIYGIDKAQDLKQTRSKSLKGKSKSPEHIENARMSQSHWWRIYPPNQEPIIILGLNHYCLNNNLDTATMCDIAHKPFNNDGKFRYHLGYRVEKLRSQDDPTTIKECVIQNMKADNKTKIYELTWPCGKIEVIRGLTEYAKQQGWPPGALYDVKDKVSLNGNPRKYRGITVKTVTAL